MIPDANVLVQDVDRLLKEVESLVERLGPGVEEVRRKVEALEWMRRGCSAFGVSDVVGVVSDHIAPMRERVAKIEDKLRASLSPQAPAPAASAPSGVAPAAEAAPLTESDDPASVAPRSLENGASPPAAAPPAAAPNGGAVTLGRIQLPRNGGHGSHTSHGGRSSYATGSAPIVPPDPEDLERIRQLEEECEREFAKLHFARDEERHAVLTIAAAKARRLRTRVHDSYAVDRRLGDLIRKIVDLKRRYRLGWIDGCERTFDVPDWDAYVERCEEHYRELEQRDAMRHEEARLARERASHLAVEAERRGRELRSYLETDEGRRGTEPEKLRAVLMSYLAVDGPLDAELVETLRVHRSLFTGIAFRRLRKGFDRASGNGVHAAEEVSAETARLRERLRSRVGGQRAVLLAGSLVEDARRRIEEALGLERLVWVDVSGVEIPALLEELGRQVHRGDVQLVLRTCVGAPSLESASIREAVARGRAGYVEVEAVEEIDAILATIDRHLEEEGASG